MAAETLAPVGAHEFASASVRLKHVDGALRMERSGENLFTSLAVCDGEAATDIEGVFRSDELGAEITCTKAGGALYGAFPGLLGQGAMQLLQPFGPDTWLLPCPRALDYSPPGDWTLRFMRDSAGLVTGVTVGCWLARQISYRRVG